MENDEIMNLLRDKMNFHKELELEIKELKEIIKRKEKKINRLRRKIIQLKKWINTMVIKCQQNEIDSSSEDLPCAQALVSSEDEW